VTEMTLHQMQIAVKRAIMWLTESGIQNQCEGRKRHGSFNAWYEKDSETYPFVYSEITGYLVTLMCYLYEKTQDEKFLRRAVMAGDWLLDASYETNGWFRCLYPLSPSRFDFKQNQIYSFDNGVIVNSMVNLYRSTKQDKYLASAVTAADWLVFSAQKPSGAFFPGYLLDEGVFFESEDEWSMCSGSFHAKNAIGLLNLYDVTHKFDYLKAATKVCDYALECQDVSGRYVSFEARGGTNAHPHCYTAEGLWVAGTYLNKKEYLLSSARGVQWLLDMQSEDGYIPRLYLDDVPIYSERVDAVSQTLRLAALHLDNKYLAEAYSGRAEILVPVIMNYQASDTDKRVDGGFYFGKTSSGELVWHVNSWVTAFAIQTLNMYSEYCRSNLALSPFLLV